MTCGRARGWQQPTGTNSRHHAPGGRHPLSLAAGPTGKNPHGGGGGGARRHRHPGGTLRDIKAEPGCVTLWGGYSVIVTRSGGTRGGTTGVTLGDIEAEPGCVTLRGGGYGVTVTPSGGTRSGTPWVTLGDIEVVSPDEGIQCHHHPGGHLGTLRLSLAVSPCGGVQRHCHTGGTRWYPWGDAWGHWGCATP